MPSSSVEGLDNVLARLRELSSKMQKKFVAHAVRKGANIIKKAAVDKAKRFDNPKTAKRVYNEITTRTNSKLGKKNGGVAISVGVKGGAKQYKNTNENRRKKRVGASYEGPGNVYYWRFLEFGTSKMKAQPFMRPAVENNVTQVTEAIVADLNDQLDKA